MKKIFSESIANLMKKSYYFKRLILYSAFITIAVIISSLIIFNYSNRILEKETIKSNNRLLAQVKIFSDRYLIEKIYTLINEKFLGFSQDSLIADFFSYRGLKDLNVFYKIHKNISNTVLNNDFIDSIYLYRTSDDILISSREGINYSISSKENVNGKFVNIELIKKVLHSDKNKNWICPFEKMNPMANSSVMSFVQLIPLYARSNNKTGCVIFNINTDTFLESIKRVYDMSDGYILIVDSKGRLFTQNDSYELFEEIKHTKILETILSQNSGFKISDINKKRMGISWLRSSLNDWYYISILPVEVLNKPSLIARQFAIIVIGLIVFLSFIGMNIITSRLYRPIKDIIYNAREKLNIKQESGNELVFINNVISDISKRMVEMKEIFEKNRGLIQYKAVIDILDRKVRIKDEIENRLKLAGKYFSYDNYGIILTEINNKTFSNLPLDQREYITYKTIEIIDKHLLKICNCISVNHPSNCIVTVINFKDHEVVLLSLRRLLKLLENELGLPYNIAASRSVSNLLLSNVYDVTSSFLKYSFIYGYGNIFIYDSIEEYESNDDKFDFNDSKKIESLLRSCQIQLLKNTITEVIESVKNNRCSYNCMQNVLLQIIRIMARISQKQGIAEKKLDRNNMMSEYKNFSYLNETVDWLFDLIDIYYNSIIVRNTHIDYEFISKIVEYVSANIDKQISLDIVAEEFNISSSHLSRIFNRCSGTSFSEFAKNKKLEKAAELIMKEQNVNVSDIEVKLGYLTPAYFSKLFKEKYGMTPTQFRKQGIINNSFHNPV